MNKQTEITNLIEQTKGKFFTLTFLKKDGTLRVINSKDKYNRLLKGGESTSAQAGYKSLINRNKDSWFSVLPEKVVSFKCGKIQKTF